MKLKNGTWKNPVFVKEMRTRMRASRAFVVMTAHLLFLGLIVGLAYFFFSTTLTSQSTLDERRIFGKAVFGIVVGLELILVCFIAPALTSNAITSEREHQTYDLLRVTLLPARALVTGKYSSGLIFIFLLLITSIPFLSPAFIFGGVSIEEILIGLTILIVTAIAFSAVGIMLSSLFKRTLISTVLAYALAIFMVFGIPLLLILGLALIGDLILPNNLANLSNSTLIFLALLGFCLRYLSVKLLMSLFFQNLVSWRGGRRFFGYLLLLLQRLFLKLFFLSSLLRYRAHVQCYEKQNS